MCVCVMCNHVIYGRASWLIQYMNLKLKMYPDINLDVCSHLYAKVNSRCICLKSKIFGRKYR